MEINKTILSAKHRLSQAEGYKPEKDGFVGLFMKPNEIKQLNKYIKELEKKCKN